MEICWFMLKINSLIYLKVLTELCFLQAFLLVCFKLSFSSISMQESQFHLQRRSQLM